ncbi:hypothetical protein P154DRAFT_188250 [Amniculicola lignicola CBS 123094]|uniref:Uncharacterized protein n=1 Tax=Amniculicola lignicola CBS 123094 TaxID=1392246 RepID=A0A6A5WU54_9PLEO|nr:hypothetical protein P154DRAFT_188250 [Amniculicola lignicola CBS 123094]
MFKSIFAIMAEWYVNPCLGQSIFMTNIPQVKAVDLSLHNFLSPGEILVSSNLTDCNIFAFLHLIPSNVPIILYALFLFAHQTRSQRIGINNFSLRPLTVGGISY